MEYRTRMVGFGHSRKEDLKKEKAEKRNHSKRQCENEDGSAWHPNELRGSVKSWLFSVY